MHMEEQQSMGVLVPYMLHIKTGSDRRMYTVCGTHMQFMPVH